MKKNFLTKSLLIVLVAFSVVSCKEDERKGYLGNEDFVRFLKPSDAIDEIASAYPVVVSFTKKDGNKTANVTFDLEEVSAVEGVDFEIVNPTKTLTFEAGKYTDTIWVKPLTNDIACGPDRKVIIKLASVDGAAAGFPKNGGSSEFALSIREVVAFNIDDFIASDYLCEEFDLAGVPYAGNPITVEVSIDPIRDNTFAVENMGDWDGLTAFFTFNPDVSNQTIQILETPNGIDPSIVGPYTNWTGSGTYDVCKRTFTVTYALKDPATGRTAAAAVNSFTPK